MPLPEPSALVPVLGAILAGALLAPLVDRAAIRLSDPDGRRRDAPRVVLGLLRSRASDLPAVRPAGFALRAGLPLLFGILALLEPALPGAALTTHLLFVAVLSLLAVADHETGLLPDAATIGGALLGLGAAWAGLGWVGLPEAAVGAAGCWGAFRLLALFAELRIGRDALGLGDVKLAGLLGAWWGFEAGMLAFACGAAAALIVLILRGGGARDAELRFGPWAIAGLPMAIALQPALDRLASA